MKQLSIFFLVFGISMIIGFAGIVADVTTSSTTASALITDNATPGRASPATATSYYRDEVIENIGGNVAKCAVRIATSPADLYSSYTHQSVTRNDGLIGSASYRQVNKLRRTMSPTATDMPAALNLSEFTFNKTVLVTVGRKELASSSFL